MASRSADHPRTTSPRDFRCLHEQHWNKNELKRFLKREELRPWMREERRYEREMEKKQAEPLEVEIVITEA